jgi:hypothetical protein
MGAIATDAEVTCLLSRTTLTLSRLLDPDEREVALGDVAELGYVGGQALAIILGLVLRRQLQLWKQWRPWFVLVSMVIPIAVLLAYLSNELGGKLFPVLVMWSRHHVAYATGLKPSAEAFDLLLNVAALVLWSWTCAFAVGVLARKTMYVPIIVFCVVCLATGWRLGPNAMVPLWTTAWGWLPVAIICLLVMAPAYHGLRYGAASSTIGRERLVLLAVGIAVVGVLAMWTRGWDGFAIENWSAGGGPLTLTRLIRSEASWEAVAGHLLTMLVLTSPPLHLLAEQISRRMAESGML